MARSSTDQSAGEWIPTFLAALRGSGVVKQACKKADIERKTAYLRRKTDEAFQLEWDAAIDEAVGAVEDELRKRALAGSDRLIEFYLTAHNRDKYGRHARVTIDAPDADGYHEMSDEELAVIAAEGHMQSERNKSKARRRKS